MKTLFFSQIIATAAISAYEAASPTGLLAHHHTDLAAATFAFTSVACAVGIVLASHLLEDMARFSRTDAQGISARTLKPRYFGVLLVCVVAVIAVDLVASYAPDTTGSIVVFLVSALTLYLSVEAADNERFRRWTIISIAIQTAAVATTVRTGSWVPGAVGISLLAALFAAAFIRPRLFGLPAPDPDAR
jgi:hypothetical protein